MKTFLVTYSCTPDIDEKVVNAIKSNSFWARVNSKAWIVQTDQNTVEIRNRIKQEVPGVESILVISIDGASWATSSVSKQVTDWMKENI